MRHKNELIHGPAGSGKSHTVRDRLWNDREQGDVMSIVISGDPSLLGWAEIASEFFDVSGMEGLNAATEMLLRIPSRTILPPLGARRIVVTIDPLSDVLGDDDFVAALVIAIEHSDRDASNVTFRATAPDTRGPSFGGRHWLWNAFTSPTRTEVTKTAYRQS
jgi:hypothetical protein